MRAHANFAYNGLKAYGNQAHTQHLSKGDYILLSVGGGGGRVGICVYYNVCKINNYCGRLTIKVPLNCTLVIYNLKGLLLHAFFCLL